MRSLFLVLLLFSCGNKTPVSIPDFVFCGWIGAIGGPNDACSCVHTIDTTIAPVHYGLNDCLNLLEGSVFMQGALFSTDQGNIDTLCVETGTCTYAQTKFVDSLKTMLTQIKKVIPRKP